jgi:hypothetical protein
MRTLVPVLLLAACSACPGGGFQPPKALPSVDQVLAKLEAGRAKAHTFRATTISNYWLGSKRLKGEVKMMGMPGAKVRFNAMDPMSNVLLDLACDGSSFVLVDHQNNCVLTGPCNGDSIAQLLHVPLEPDDFFYLAVGQTPTLPGATGKVTWDSKHGHEVVELTGDAGSQTILIDARDGRWDVVQSELRGADGKVIWSVKNKDFADLTGDDSPPTTMRVPGTSWFQSPAEHSDVIVDWNERDLNAELPAPAFVLEPPTGLAQCGAKKP